MTGLPHGVQAWEGPRTSWTPGSDRHDRERCIGAGGSRPQHTCGRRPLTRKAPVKPMVPDGPTHCPSLHLWPSPAPHKQLLPCFPSKWDDQRPTHFQVPWPRTTAPDRGRSPCDDHSWDPGDRLPTLAPTPRTRPPGSGHTLTFPVLLGRGCWPQNSRPNLTEEGEDMRPKRQESISSSSVHATRPSRLWG